MPISEAGWSVCRSTKARYASAGLALLLERAHADGRWGAIHAFPGATNAASNALCRKFGFELVGQETVDYGGRALRCNHWVLAATERRPKRARPMPGCAVRRSVASLRQQRHIQRGRTMTDVKNWEDQLIAEMRANDGKVTQGPLAGRYWS